jgi:hypothetical protein
VKLTAQGTTGDPEYVDEVDSQLRQGYENAMEQANDPDERQYLVEELANAYYEAHPDEYSADMTPETFLAAGEKALADFQKDFPDYDTYSEAMKTNLQTVMDNSDPAMAINLDILTDQVAKGGFKSTFDTGTSATPARQGNTPEAVASYQKTRADAEKKLYNLDEEGTPTSDRPKYGFMINKDNPEGYIKDSATNSMYGDATVVFKSSVRSRTTVNEQDSMDAMSEGAPRFPSPVDRVSHLSVFPGTSLSEKAGVMMQAKIRRGAVGYDYHEAQYHGKLTTKDINEEGDFTWSVVS